MKKFREDFIPQSFATRVTEGLSPKTRKRLRKLNKKERKKPEPVAKKYFPGLIGNDEHPFNPRVGGTMAGPGSFGPVSIGGIIRHS